MVQGYSTELNAGARRRRERATSGLFRMEFGALRRFLRGQPASFWLLNIYMFFEYVRPQSIWTALAIVPWSTAALAGAAVMMFLEGSRSRYRTLAGTTLALFTVVLVASSFTALNQDAAFAKWWQYFNWVILYILITSIVTTERRFLVFMVAFMLYCLKMSQHGFKAWVQSGFSFVAWGVSGAPGWFQNSGEFGIQMCIFLPLIVEFILALRGQWTPRVRWIAYIVPLTAVGSIIASSSRGALIGGAAVMLWWVFRSKHRIRSLVAVTVVSAAVWMVVPQEQKARFDTAGEDDTSISRTDRWKAGIEMANEYPVLGIGYNGWQSYYGPLSHNIFIEAWAELGYSGLIAFLLMIGGTFVVNARTRRIVARIPTTTPFMRHMAYGLDGALIGFLASGFFVTVLYYPFFWVNLSMTAALHVTAQTEYARARAGMHARNPDSGAGFMPQTAVNRIG